MDKEKVCMLALEAGFMLSTMHGQDSPKLMPVSDSKTLLAFADLVAKAERERCMQICYEVRNEGDTGKHGEGYEEGHMDGCNNCASAIFDLE